MSVFQCRFLIAPKYFYTVYLILLLNSSRTFSINDILSLCLSLVETVFSKKNKPSPKVLLTTGTVHHYNHNNNKLGSTHVGILEQMTSSERTQDKDTNHFTSGCGCDSQRGGNTLPAGKAEGTFQTGPKLSECLAISSQILMNTHLKCPRVPHKVFTWTHTRGMSKNTRKQTHTYSFPGVIKADLTATSICLVLSAARWSQWTWSPSSTVSLCVIYGV